MGVVFLPALDISLPQLNDLFVQHSQKRAIQGVRSHEPRANQADDGTIEGCPEGILSERI